MPDIITEVEQAGEAAVTWLETAVSNIVHAVGAEVVSDAEAILETAAQTLLQAGVNAITGQHVGALTTSLLNGAGAQGKTMIVNLAPEVLNALVSTFVANKVAA